MIAFSIDDSFDIFLDSHHQIARSSGKDAYAVILGSMLRTVQGECVLDTDAGIPYFDTVFNTRGDFSTWKNTVVQKVLAYDFVKSVDSFVVNVDYTNKTLSYTMRVTTTDGTVELSSGGSRG